MADDSGNITIELNLETGQFTSSLNTAKEGLNSIGSGEGLSQTSTKFLELNAMLELASKAIDAVKIIWDSMVVSSVEASMKHEQAVTQMNNSLAANGLMTEGVSEHIEKYAETLSRTTVIGENQTNQAFQMAAQYAKNEDQLNKLAQAALNYSTATGRDLSTSMRTLGGSLTGMNVGLNRMLPGFKNMGSAALTAGAAIDEINRRYGGAAAAQAQTFTGHLTMMKNAWEELHVSVGNAITQSPEINKIMELITKAIHSATDAIKTFVSGGGIENLIKSLTSVGTTIASYIVQPLEIMANAGKFSFDVMVLGIDEIIAALVNVSHGIIDFVMIPFEKMAEGIGTIVGKFNSTLGHGITESAKSIGEGIRSITGTLAKSSEDVVKDASANVTKDFDNMLKTPWADKAKDGINAFSDAMKNAIAPGKALADNVEKLGKTGKGVGDAFTQIGAGFKEEAIATAAAFDKNFQAAGKTMESGIGHASANAFASFGKAIAEGKNAMAEFGKAFISAIGNTCVSLGSSFMVQAAAMFFSPNPEDNAKAPGLAATGAALAAFGGLLSGVGGGGNSSYAATASGGGSAVSGGPGTPGTTAVSSMQPQQNAQIVINGDFLNSSETANHLTQILRQNSDTTNYTITAQGQNYQ